MVITVNVVLLIIITHFVYSKNVVVPQCDDYPIEYVTFEDAAMTLGMTDGVSKQYAFCSHLTFLAEIRLLRIHFYYQFISVVPKLLLSRDPKRPKFSPVIPFM